MGLPECQGSFCGDSPIRPTLPQAISSAYDFAIILREKDAQRATAHFAIIVHIARDLISGWGGNLEFLKTTWAGDGRGMHRGGENVSFGDVHACFLG